MEWVIAWRIKVTAENQRSTALKLLEIMGSPNSRTMYFGFMDEDGELHEVDLKKMAEEYEL